MKILVNRSTDRVGNLRFAVCQLIDGMVRTYSLGYLFTDLTLRESRRLALRRMREEQKSRGLK